jgi:hypothetical protein
MKQGMMTRIAESRRKGLVLWTVAIAVVLVTGGLASYADERGRRRDRRPPPQSPTIAVTAGTLTGYQETPMTISSAGTGSFTATVDPVAQTISYELRYSGLDPTAAHIHFGARGTSGGVAAFLCGGGTKPACPAGTTTPAVVTGMIIPADVGDGAAGQGIAAGEFAELVRAILAGVTYANVHTLARPGGEIRGQISVRASGHDDAEDDD